MRYFYLVLIAFAFLYTANATNYSTINLKVGTQPLEVFFDSTTMKAHVFCDGSDEHWDGKKDANDENSSWWTIDMTNSLKSEELSAIKVKDFEFGSIGFTFRPIWDLTARKIYITHLGKVETYNIDTYEQIKEETFDIAAAALACDENNIYFSMINYKANGKVLVYNKSKQKVTDTLTAGNMTRQCIVVGNKLYILNEGSNGHYDAQIDVYSTDNFHDHKIVPLLGNIANYLQYNSSNNKIYICMNGENQILYYDINSGTIIDSLKNSKIFPDNFRECKIRDNKAFISSYNGFVYIYDLNTKALLDSLGCSGAVEGLDISKNAIFATNIYKKGSYDYTDSVSIFIDNSLSVVCSHIPAELNIYPNPVQQNANLKIISDDLLSGSISLQIYNAAGRTMYSRNYGYVSSNTFETAINTESISLVSGTYYVEINIGNKKYHSSFVTYN